MAEIDLNALAAEFPRDAVSWRAQSLTADGSKALALAYIDARDVMDRLDAVCGAANWQDRYEFHGVRTVCYLSLRINGEWVTKADGAGDSDVEAEKGAISDALKRAAVKWGIGRYLYALETPWVPCEHAEKGGRKYWKRWKADPWSCVRGASAPARSTPTPAAPAARLSESESAPIHDEIDFALDQAGTALAEVWKANWSRIQTLHPAHEESLTKKKDALKAALLLAA